MRKVLQQTLKPKSLNWFGCATGNRQFSTESGAEVKSQFNAGHSIQGSFKEGRAIYLDVQATSPTDPRVLDAMLPFETLMYGNPHSKTHHFGWETEEASEEARGHIGTCIGAGAKDIIFTSGKNT